MFIVFLISLHALLMLAYLMAIEMKISRHQYAHLLFAACLPFVGEACLLLSEFGKAEESGIQERLFRSRKTKRIAASSVPMPFAQPITRKDILEIIETKPSNEVELLREALKAKDAEVVHLAAATIMRMQQEYENRISSVSNRYKSFPDDMNALEEYIDLLGEYHARNLLVGESAKELLLEQEDFINRLLAVMPSNLKGILALIDNYELQGRIDEALEICKQQRRRLSDYQVWKKSLLLLKKYRTSECAALYEESRNIWEQWTYSEMKQWQMLARCEG